MIEREVSADWILASWDRKRQSHPVEITETKRVVVIESSPSRKERAIADLREWMAISEDYAATVKKWSAKYIVCGRCKRGFVAWYDGFDPGPEDDLEAWLQAAIKIVTEKRWI